MDPLSSPGSSSSKQNPHLSTKTTNNANRQSSEGEEFGAIHPLRDFTSPGRGDSPRPQPLVLSIFFLASSLTKIRFSELKWNQSTRQALGGDGPSHDPNPALLGALRHLIHSFSAAKISQRCTNTKNSSWVTLSHPLLVMRWFMLFVF